MKVYDAANIRNVALIGHSASGKTQLISAALFDAGTVNRFGKVDEGTTVTVALPLVFTAPTIQRPSSNIATLTPASRSPSHEQPPQVKKSA